MRPSRETVNVLSIINDLVFGGDESRLLNLALTIDRSAYRLDVVTFKRPTDGDAMYGSMRRQYAEAGIAVTTLGEGRPNEGRAAGSLLRQLRRTLSFVIVLFRLVALIRRRRIDVIDSHTGPGNLLGVVAGALTRRPCVITTYDVEQWEPRWLWFALHQLTLRLAGAVITDSDAVAGRIARFARLGRPNTVVIPNGVVPPLSATDADTTRRILGIPWAPSCRVVGQISSLFPYKGHHVLIEAVPLVLEQVPDAAFLIVGYSRGYEDYARRLHRRIHELGIAARVRITGYPGDIADVWNLIDVHVHPSLLDSLPNTILEGMSLGKPAVVTDVGGISTAVKHGHTGLVVPPGDHVALAAALVGLLTDAERATSLGAAAHERYVARYTRERMSRRLEAVFAQVVA